MNYPAYRDTTGPENYFEMKVKRIQAHREKLRADSDWPSHEEIRNAGHQQIQKIPNNKR